MKEGSTLHQEGDGRISNLRRRINQIDLLYSGEKAIREGIGTAGKTAKELKEDYVNDKLASEKNNPEKHQSMLNEFQL